MNFRIFPIVNELRQHWVSRDPKASLSLNLSHEVRMIILFCSGDWRSRQSEEES
jgi:hypothetical protein